MIRECAWCGKFMGFKKPFFSVLLYLLFGRRLEVTHTICPKCSKEQGVDPGPPE